MPTKHVIARDIMLTVLQTQLRVFSGKLSYRAWTVYHIAFSTTRSIKQKQRSKKIIDMHARDVTIYFPEYRQKITFLERYINM